MQYELQSGSALHQMISLMLPYTYLQSKQCNMTLEAGNTPSNPCDGNIFCVWLTQFVASSPASGELQQLQPCFLSRYSFLPLYWPLHHGSPCVCSHMLNYTGEKIYLEIQPQKLFPIYFPIWIKLPSTTQTVAPARGRKGWGEE